MAGRCQEVLKQGISEDSFIVNEVPTGLINSLNKDYELLNDPVIDTVVIYLNGLYQFPGIGKDYTISGKTISFTKAPRTNSELGVSYIKDEVV